MTVSFPEPQLPETEVPFAFPDLFPEVETKSKIKIQIDAKLHGQAFQVVDAGPKRDGLLRLLQKLHRGCRTPDIGHPLLEDGVPVAVGGLERYGFVRRNSLLRSVTALHEVQSPEHALP